MYVYIHTLAYQKHYFIHFCCLFLKLLKAFGVSLRWLVFKIIESLQCILKGCVRYIFASLFFTSKREYL